MESAFAVERIDALTEGSGDLPFDRPQVWSGIGPLTQSAVVTLRVRPSEMPLEAAPLSAVFRRAYNWSIEE